MTQSGHLRAVEDLYDGLAKDHGDSLLTVQRPRGRQELVFSVLLDSVPEKSFSLLDVGCGVGFLLEYLLGAGYDVNYTGLDVSAEVIRICRNKFSGVRGPEFLHGTLSDIPSSKTFDYAVVSGAFNNNPANLSDHEFLEMVKECISSMFSHANTGVFVNFASSYVDYVAQGAFHVSPEVMFSFAKTLSRRVSLRHDYMPYEFTLHIFKDDRISDNNVFNAWEKNG